MEAALAEKKLLDQVRDVIRSRHYCYKTEKSYVRWILQFILFHHKRHPKDIGEQEIAAFLTPLATGLNVDASTQNQALNAIVFLYKQVLHKELSTFQDIQWAKRSQRLPVVLTQEEVRRVLQHLSGREKIMACNLYGADLRLMECLRLRVKDIDFSFRHIYVRSGKGDKDRVTMLPEAVKTAIQKAGIHKQAGCHTFRHSGVYPPFFGRTTHLLENGYDIRTVQELLGHSDVRTTMTYTHVLNRGGLGVRSPLDAVK